MGWPGTGVGLVTESVGTSMKPGVHRDEPGSEAVGANLMPKSTKVGLVPGSTGGGLVHGPGEQAWS